MKNVVRMLAVFAVICTVSVHAQDNAPASKEEVEEVKGAVDGINETLLEVKTTVDALKKIKISGYIQAQYQVADSAGVGTFAGPNFPGGVLSRFSVRRGRIKATYDNDLTKYVLQIDVTQRGVGIKDAYAYIKEPWLRTFALTAGIFDRPFGFEISYSSSDREAPERTRMYQTLFPGERELGAKLEVMPEDGIASYFNLKVGVFNGVLNTADENDNHKDIIGRLGFTAPMRDEGLEIDGGVSMYMGKVTNRSTSEFNFGSVTIPSTTGNATVVPGFISTTGASVLGKLYDRNYMGVDLQLYYDLPVIGGLSLRGEFISGKQPGTAGSNSFYNTAAADPVYNRKFSGFYINYIQNLGLSDQLIVKYDVFDPNTDVKGEDIGAVTAGSNLGLADIKYSTFGIGIMHHWDANVKFTLYYDMVKNEAVNANAKGSLAAFKEDIKDNVWTLRMQVRF